MKKKIILSICLLGATAHAFDLNSAINEGSKILNNTNNTSMQSDYQTQGLKKALEIGTKYAIDSLSKDGFLKNNAVKIPLPNHLQNTANIASKIGGQKYVDDFIKTMNLAAGDAVMKTTPVFIDAIKNLSIQDAQALLTGKDDSITNYFKQKTNTKLLNIVKPIVQKATKQNRLTSSYSALMSVTKQNNTISNALNKAQNIAGAFGIETNDNMPQQDEDLDTFITRKTLDGMFYMIAKEEKKIRNNPLSYSSSIIQKVFGK